ncbi:nucleoside recognition domain-containing protein [Eisenibacter elegans]|jgi:spore maturation protein SpmA|uniref:nucleoside recognition domain-containing protein n=1 Tax=Eisenibacter elegans TaxID=997 RepID=UPI00040EB647|nr:nucleoside recognition domain-containing protein [Eisenibacter elegans]
MILNYIWIGFFLLAFIIACVRLVVLGDTEVFPILVNSTFESAETAFKLALNLTGAMAMWLGIMKIGEKAGVVSLLAYLFGPFFKRLFPEIPANHPAIAPIFMKLSANLLGLDNAGTPLGIKAMKEMQSLNPTPDTASNAQIMFAVLNTTGLTFIPVQVLLYRSQYGAANPAEVFIPILLSTSITALSGMMIVAVRQRLNLFDRVFLTYLLGIFAVLSTLIYTFSQLPQERISHVSGVLSNFLLFSIIIFFIVLALVRGQGNQVFSAFIEGAKEGFDVMVQLIPYLVSVLIAVGVFRDVKALDVIISYLEYMFRQFSLDPEFTKALPVAFMKPLSGSGATGMALDTMKAYGVDSFAGKLSSVFQGTTDTTLFILAVYFGSVNIKKIRYATSAGLMADLIGITAAIIICYLFFG